MEILDGNPMVSAKLVQFMSCMIVQMNEALIKMAYNSARKRVAEAVIYISGKYIDDAVLPLIFPMSRNDISAISGISPESVSRNLSDFRSEGLIDTYDGLIKILDLKKLTNLKN
jgi:CRP/FNR family transcriptional regulator, polysaccharide utilization system transcription regulator